MKTIFKGKKIVVRERDGWEFVERKSAREAVAIIAVTSGRLILTEQYRRPVDARVIDLPAGLIEEHGPGETARRELEEETGFTCERVRRLAKAPTSPGITSEIVYYYRAVKPRRSGKGGGVGDENITVHVIALSGIERWLKKQGALVDAKVWAGLYFAVQST
jgi:ADP-ribose pyrophosphatase